MCTSFAHVWIHTHICVCVCACVSVAMFVQATKSKAVALVVSTMHANELAEGVVEPLRVKTQAISSAQEATDLVLRIDDIIAAGNLSKGPSDMGDDPLEHV